MKVLVAVDSFKGSISSIEASKAISEGIQESYPDAEIIALPLADGGEGTVEALLQATGGMKIETKVKGPLSIEKTAIYGILDDGKTAVIEVAEACGLTFVSPEQRNPLLATTYGVGELIADAIGKGCREFVIGLGGSATNDGGIGMLQALGFRFLDGSGNEVELGGQALKKITGIDGSGVLPELMECHFRIACDVNNVLYGPTGAAHIFGPQKGATPEMVEELDEGLRNFAQIVLEQLGIDLQSIAGAGAAGGLGAAFSGFLHSEMESGIDLIMDITNMEQKMQGADIAVTGEGKLDDQTAMGKAPLGVARLAAVHGIPVVALAGAVSPDVWGLNKLGMTSCFSIVNSPMTLEEAMDPEVAFNNLKRTAAQLFRLIQRVAVPAEKLQN
ncbi:glycerate kinase [Planomicrobium sp. CPCC 101079]|uniref:glycerate kinase n=1 Tax=Planomicrobium sp. CPCC 101079 TaxID=2599618 RepID=UPI0011B74BF9|nr:glycerate kinase [Planomicrobium sp. CPCC 101079]TWT01829.1 glycerate kinase [Planomicrobium sp. CPCC 101079]